MNLLLKMVGFIGFVILYKGKRDHLLTLLMYCFNYEHDGWSKHFL